MIEVEAERFEQLVADALDGIPEEIAARMNNVAVFVTDGIRPGLLGLYEGIPLTRREQYGGLALPDRISIFRRAICQMCSTEAEVIEQVRVTVVHEVAHHFGISDSRLVELGYG